MYKDLQVYQKAYKLAVSLYKFTRTMPKEEQYGLSSQIRRAASSVPLNITEGYAKGDTDSETKRFLRMAKGSVSELEVLMDLCLDLDYITKDAHASYVEKIQEIRKMLHGLYNSISQGAGEAARPSAATQNFETDN